MTLASIVFMYPNSIAGAAALLAGEALGASAPAEAKAFIHLGIVVDYINGVLIGVVLYVLRFQISRAFTGDPDIQQLTFTLLPIMSEFVYLLACLYGMFCLFNTVMLIICAGIYVAADACGCITIALLRSVGRPMITVIVNMCACVTILLPLGYYLAVVAGYGLTGLWGAMALAWFLASCVYLAILLRTDWAVEAAEAGKRNNM